MSTTDTGERKIDRERRKGVHVVISIVPIQCVVVGGNGQPPEALVIALNIVSASCQRTWRKYHMGGKMMLGHSSA